MGRVQSTLSIHRANLQITQGHLTNTTTQDITVTPIEATMHSLALKLKYSQVKYQLS